MRANLRRRTGSRARGHLHSRPGNDAAVDRVPDIRIGVTRAFRFQITNAREPILQRSSRVYRSQDRPVLRRLLQQLFVVIRCRDVALQKHVRVRIDQARQTCFTGKIDDIAARGGASNLFNLLAFDHQHNIRARLIRFSIQQPAALDK